MKKLQYVGCVLSVCIVFSLSARCEAQAPPARSVTLAEVLRYAREHPPAVRVALARLAQLRAEQAYARAAYAPSLSVEASSGLGYDNRETTPNKIQVPDAVPAELRGAYRDAARIPRYEATSLDSDGRLSLDYPLVDGTRGHRVEAAAHAVESQSSSVAEAEREAIGDAAQLYLESLAASRLVDDARVNVGRRTEQAQAVRGLVAAGLRPPVDATRAEIELVAARFAVETREVEEQASWSALAVALGDDPMQPLRPEDLDDASWPAPLDPRTASARAAEQRPEVRALEQRIAALRAEHRSVLAERFPTLGLRASGQVTHADILMGTGIQGFSYLGGGALYLRWDLFDAGVRRRAQVAQRAIAQAQRELEQALLAARGEAVAAAYQAKRARTLLEQMGQVLAAAESARSAQNQRYRAGVASLLDLLDASAVEQTARRQRIEAERDYRVARVRLLAVTGMIDALAR